MTNITLPKQWFAGRRPSKILHDASPSIELPAPPKRFFHHGWQSWSLATWADPTRIPVQQPVLLHPLQIDPEFAGHPHPHGSWLGAVQFEDSNILLLGSLDLDAHVELDGDQLRGWHTAGNGDWWLGYGPEADVFARYAKALAQVYGGSRAKKPPRVWSSWYSLYSAVDERVLKRILEEWGEMPFDVIQVDDGWQVSIGDWQANPSFPSGMRDLAARIRATGRKAGLWLAPFLGVRSSHLFQEHPDWFLRDRAGKLVPAGHNWAEALFALDSTRPDVQAWLTTLMKQVRAWGFDYLKLDFLYAAALPGRRHVDMGRERAYREALHLLRASMGKDAYFVACGAPILPSLGLCDALRIGPDVSGEWENRRDAILLRNPSTPGIRNAIRTSLHRLWLKPLVQLDADVAYFRSVECELTSEHKALLKALCLICDFKATSDPPQWLSAVERAEMETFLKTSPTVEQTGPYTFRVNGQEVDFSPAVLLPEPARGLDRIKSLYTAWLGNQGWALKANDRLNRQALKRLNKKI